MDWAVFVVLVGLSIIITCSGDVGIVVLRPNEIELQGVEYADTVYLEVAVWVNDGSQIPKETVICASEVLPELEHSGGKKLCIAGSRFYMSGFMTGTNLMNITAERIASSDAGDGEVFTSKLLLIDAVDSVLMRVHIDKGQLSQDLWEIAPGLKPLDYFYYANPFPAMPHHTDFTLIARMDTVTHGGTESANAVSAHSSATLGQRRVRLALFARIAPQFVPSDRFLDWICDHAFLAAQGVDVVVIAPTAAGEEKSAEPTICGAPVVYFACLRESEAASYIPSGAGPSVLTEPAVLPLAEYLSQHIDALLVVNSYGDAQTSLLLDVVQAMKRAAAGESLASAEDSASLRDWHAPLVIMDLPNLSLPKHWNGKLDGFIAPSKAAALHYDTIAHKRPVAVIYPPVRDLVIQSSVCAAEYFSQFPQAEQAVKSHASERVDSAFPASLTVAAASGPTLADASQLDPQHFNVLFVGRLARVKSPGLLLKALGYLLATANAQWEEILSAAGGSGEETVEQRYVQDLQRIVLQYETEHPDAGGEPVRPMLTRVLREFRAAVRVTFVGGGTAALTQALQALAGALNVSTQVMLVGVQAPERVVQYMQQAHVLVNPIVPGETFGFIHIEAAAQGLPVIAFDMCANGESVVLFGDTQSNSTSTSVGVQSALLPYREGAVVQDLALALLTAYLQHRRRQHEVQLLTQEVDAAPAQGQEERKRTVVRRDRIERQRVEVCDDVLPIFRHWNSRQHSRALVDALLLFLRSAGF